VYKLGINQVSLSKHNTSIILIPGDIENRDTLHIIDGTIETAESHGSHANFSDYAKLINSQIIRRGGENTENACGIVG
jgi:hypothetical protein